MERGDDLDGSLVFERAHSDAAAAKPALFRILQDWRLAFFRMAYEGIAHANLHTLAAPGADILVEIDVLKRHRFPTRLQGSRIIYGFSRELGYHPVGEGCRVAPRTAHHADRATGANPAPYS